MNTNFLAGSRAYLSGPMDFVASREEEAANGWRTRLGQFLRAQGCIVFDPWKKPDVRGMSNYGREGINTTDDLNRWVFDDTVEGAQARGTLANKYKETTHIDLRMVDTCDFVIARCPTNIYSVGTPHEISLARSQRKPVLFVSPPVEFPTYDMLKEHLKDDSVAMSMLEKFVKELPLKKNENGIPSLWYIPIVGSENFFDGFGFDQFREQFGWEDNVEDVQERSRKIARPLLPFLINLKRTLPKKWNVRNNEYTCNDDFLLWNHRKSTP